MKTILVSFFLFFALHVNCRASKIHLTDSVKTLSALKAQKSATDKFLKSNPKNLIVMVKVPGRKALQVIRGNKWPDEIEYTYNILKNNSGKVVFVVQMPYSESGDWDITYKHYFDDKGKTYYLHKSEWVFNDNVKGGVVRWVLSKFYDENYRQISKTDAITDQKGTPIKEGINRYDFPGYKYQEFKTLKECLKAYDIPLIK